MADIIKLRKRHRLLPHIYMNLQLALSSFAEIERLSSLAGGMLADKRQCLTQLLFESHFIEGQSRIVGYENSCHCHE